METLAGGRTSAQAWVLPESWKCGRAAYCLRLRASSPGEPQRAGGREGGLASERKRMEKKMRVATGVLGTLAEELAVTKATLLLKMPLG